MSRQLVIEEVDRVMVLAPHPDDETLATGGLLEHAVCAGAAVRVVFATDGENNPWPQRVLERRWRIGEAGRARWGARRRAEALAALGCLGVPESKAGFLGLPDQGLTPLLLEARGPIVDSLARELAGWRPTVLAAPSIRDGHPDHSALGVLAELALRRLLEAERPLELRYVVHRSGRRAGFDERIHVALSPSDQHGKRRAILQHRSQLVFRRRGFLRFAGESEAFAGRAGAAAVDARHPVRDVDVAGDWLRLEITSGSPLAPLGSTLWIVAADADCDGPSLSVALPARSGPAGVCSGGRAVGSARFVGERARGEVFLPLAWLPEAHSLFVKLRHRVGFFDEDGWRAVPSIGALREVSPTTSDAAFAGGHLTTSRPSL